MLQFFKSFSYEFVRDLWNATDFFSWRLLFANFGAMGAIAFYGDLLQSSGASALAATLFNDLGRLGFCGTANRLYLPLVRGDSFLSLRSRCLNPIDDGPSP